MLADDRASMPWVIVAGGVSHRGGMDRANAHLADAIVAAGHPLHLVAHHVDARYLGNPMVDVHLVPPPLGSFFLGQLALDRRGREVAAEVRAASPEARVVVNGGNCAAPGINWVHCVHQAWACVDAGAPLWFRAKNHLAKRVARRQERDAFARAELLLANSRRTARDLVTLLGVPPERVATVYLGADPSWVPATPDERRAALEWLGLDARRPTVAFVGALGLDRNKGIDTLWRAWRRLGESWDAQLVVAGEGRGAAKLRAEVAEAGLEDSVRVLGWTDRIADVLAASDVLVSPVRYEAYGLNVQEALSRGLPAIVSARAGVAERYDAALAPLLLHDPEDDVELAALLERWRADVDGWKARARPLGDELRRWSWADMATAMVRLVDTRLPPRSRRGLARGSLVPAERGA